MKNTNIVEAFVAFILSKFKLWYAAQRFCNRVFMLTYNYFKRRFACTILEH